MNVYLLIAVLFTSIGFTQDKKFEFESIGLEGKVKDKIPLDVEMIDSEGEEEDLKPIPELPVVSKEPTEEDNDEFEVPLVEVKKVEEVQAKVPPAIIEEEFEAIPERTSSFEFLFDNSKPALFETKLSSKSLELSLGAMTFENEEYQDSGAGGKTKRQWSIPIMRVAMNFDGAKFLFSPYFQSSLPKKGADGLLKKFYTTLGLDVGYRVHHNLKIFTATSLLMKIIKGTKSGEVELPGNQGTFFVNKSAKFSLMNTLDFGIESRIEDIGIEFRVSSLSLFKKEDRQFGFGIFLSYFFDLKTKKRVSK